MKSAALVIAIGAIADASPKKDPPAPASFDDKSALDNFAAAMAAQKAGKADHPLRISYFGDSLTADDQITNGLRKRLQADLGDGGAGFVFAAPPHPYCEHRAVTRYYSGFQVWGISTTAPADRLLGLGGSAESDGDGVVAFAPTGPVHTVDIHYLAQPHGGSFDVKADGKVVQTVDTKAKDKQSAFALVTVPDGTKKIRFEAKGRVRLFGASLEAQKGVVVDNLGVVNATAKGMDTNDMPEHLQNQLAHRQSDLVIVMYGTNEAEWLAPKGAGMEEHEKVFGDILQHIRDANPKGSCLVVAPMDQLDWRADGMPPRTSIPAMVDAQRRAAKAHGCAFWDTYQWMGGKGASREWYHRGWIVNDFQHPTSEGAERLAEALYAGLVGGK